MTTYIGFLRAINLGAKRKFPKAEIVTAVEGLGWTDVRTHINTGNIRFDCPLTSRTEVEAALEEAFLVRAGFEVPTIVVTPEELRTIAGEAEAFGHDGHQYVSFLKEPLSAEAVRWLEERSTAEEVAKAGTRAVHLLTGGDYHRSGLTNATVKRHLGVSTDRNVTVVRALVEKWC